MILFLGLMITALQAAEPAPVFTSSNGSCQVFQQKDQSEYHLVCKDSRQKFVLTPDSSLEESYRALEKSMSQHSSNPTHDETLLKKIVLAHFEERYRFQYPGDEALVRDLTKELENLGQKSGPFEDCGPESLSPVTPFVDLRFDPTSEKEIERKLVDRKMAQEGFINLGKLQGVSVELNTENDNFLHGIGRQFIEDTSQLPWWEGDDRGRTFSVSSSAEMIYEKGSIKISPYTSGYSELTRVDGKIRDEENRRYQNFVSVDGLELEVRINQTNGDKYIKIIGSVERLTDSDKGLARKIQDAWHEAGNAIDYRYLDHRSDKTRLQGGLAVGVSKSAKPLSWLGVKMAIEGKAQASTGGLENSYVGVATEISIDSNQLFRKHSGAPPLIEARLKADHKHYGDNHSYTNVGVTLYGTVYSDQKGNVVKVFAGVEEYKDPLTRRYAHAEYERRNRVDLNHTFGIRYEKKF